MFYFMLTEANVGFAALLNDGVRPSVLDENGNIQFFITYTDERHNEIHSYELPYWVKKVGTKISFGS